MRTWTRVRRMDDMVQGPEHLFHLEMHPLWSPLREIISRIKIGGALSLMRLGLGVAQDEHGLLLVVELHAPDRYDHEQWVKVTQRSYVPTPMPVGALPEWIVDQVARVLRHEACEGMRLDGVLIVDPHKDDPK